MTLAVKNSGEFEHELVVVRTSRRASKLPVSGKEASEKGAVGEVEDIGAGKTKRLTLSLKKGHYVLICNIAGHVRGRAARGRLGSPPRQHGGRHV